MLVDVGADYNLDPTLLLRALTPRTRAKFSNRLLSDIFVRLLRATDVPVLLLR